MGILSLSSMPSFVLADVRINLTPSAFEVDVAHNRRAAVTGTGDVEHVQVILLDDSVQMHVDEVLAGRRAPVADHQRLHVRQLQRPGRHLARVVIAIAQQPGFADGTVAGQRCREQVGQVPASSEPILIDRIET